MPNHPYVCGYIAIDLAVSLLFYKPMAVMLHRAPEDSRLCLWLALENGLRRHVERLICNNRTHFFAKLVPYAG